MSKQQHTPAPWRADISPTETHGVFARFNIRTEDRVSIACGQSQEHLGEAGIHEQEMLANVRLITVAPDLLDDLEEAAATMRRYEALHRAKNTE